LQVWFILVAVVFVAFFTGFLTGYCVALDDRDKGKGDRHD